MDPAAARARFIRANTRLQSPPLVPEVELFLAAEVMALWGETELLAGAKELGLGQLPPPYWAFAWPGGQALARHLLDRPDEVRGRSVIDFGTGSGLVAIAAARAGAARVEAWDVDPFCEGAVRVNAEANGVSVMFRAGSPLGRPDPGAEVVLAGDVFYERELAADFLAWGRALAGRGVRVLAGDPGRIYSPREGLEEVAAFDVPTSLATEDRPVMRTRIVRVPPR